MASYLAIEGYSTAAGLTHQKHNLDCLLCAAYQRSAIPLVPTFRLSGQHNHGRELTSDLSTYFDYGRLTVAGRPYPVRFADDPDVPESEVERLVVELDAVQAVHGVLWQLPELRDVPHLRIELPYQDVIVRTAELVASRLRPFTCVHVRGGDRALDPEVAAGTDCANILACITKCGLTTAYIMTNEDPSRFEALRSVTFEICDFRDFDELRAIDDNYLLFCVENEIMRRAAKRVSTFKTASDWPEVGYYDFSLTSTPGWQ